MKNVNTIARRDKPKNPAKREEVKMLNCRTDVIPKY
jgi:hypothetical protein